MLMLQRQSLLAEPLVTLLWHRPQAQQLADHPPVLRQSLLLCSSPCHGSRSHTTRSL
jgi:hypothetical protein